MALVDPPGTKWASGDPSGPYYDLIMALLTLLWPLLVLVSLHLALIDPSLPKWAPRGVLVMGPYIDSSKIIISRGNKKNSSDYLLIWLNKRLCEMRLN